MARLRCESRGGNPPAGLKWFIDDEELGGSSQKNETEVGDNRKWNAVSVIEVSLRRVSIVIQLTSSIRPGSMSQPDKRHTFLLNGPLKMVHGSINHST